MQICSVKDFRILMRRSFVIQISTVSLLRPPSNASPLLTEGIILRPTATALSSALRDYISSDTPFCGQKIHSHILKTGFRPNINVSIKLLILHLKCNCLKYAGKLFDELPQKTTSAYDYMIGGYLRHGLVEESIRLFRKFVHGGGVPGGYMLSMILKASTSVVNGIMPFNFGRAVHTCILKLDVEPDDVLYTALIDSHVKSGKIQYARAVFDMMNEKNVMCSTSMISGYMNQGLTKDAEDIFARTTEKDLVVYNALIEGYSKSVKTSRKAFQTYIDMQRFGFVPSLSTFASIAGACSVLAGFRIGQQIQGQLTKSDFLNDIKIGSALVDMYSKCGEIEYARQVFDEMPVKNVFSWTSLIDGYGKNGNPIEALKLFHEMRAFSVAPNYVTVLGVLSACAHAGLVAEGWMIFRTMERDYSLKPRMEHYACMVDLLGRAGSLSQAWELVMSMPNEPNSDVWAALLSSCNLHGNIEMANFAANELFKLNAKSRPAAYVSLSNALASAGKWHSVTNVRDIMKLRGMIKSTGSSWVGTELLTDI